MPVRAGKANKFRGCNLSQPFRHRNKKVRKVLASDQKIRYFQQRFVTTKIQPRIKALSQTYLHELTNSTAPPSSKQFRNQCKSTLSELNETSRFVRFSEQILKILLLHR